MQRRWHYTGFLLLLALLQVQGLHAQGDSIPSVELSPIIVPEFIYPNLVGSFTQTIDSAERQIHFHQNLDAVMQAAPGVYVKSYGLGGIATPAFRGTGAGHTQLYWEGIPINSSTLGLQDFSLVSSALFDQIDLLYGGGSLQEGSGGLGGAINLESDRKYGRFPRSYKHTLSQEVGSFASSRTSFVSQYNSLRNRGSTRFSFNTARNDFPFVNTGQLGSPTQRQVNAGVNQFSFLQDLSLNNRLFAAVWLYDTQRELPPTMLTSNNGEQQRDRGLRSTLQWNHHLGSSHLLALDGAWLRETTLYENPVAEIYAPSSGNRFVVQGKLSRTDNGSWKRIVHKESRLRIQHDRARTDGFADIRTRTQATASTQFKYKIRGRTHLFLLLREDLNDQKLSPLMGYLGMKGKLPARLYWSANLARNHRQPTLNDLYWVPGGNPNLLPETSLASDLALRWRPEMHNWVRPSARLTGFANLVDNWILWVPGTGNIWSPENVNQVLARGLEAEVAIEKVSGPFRYDLRASWTITRSEVRTTTTPNDPSLGKQLIYTPLHAAKAHARLRYRAFHLSYTHEFTGPRFTTRDNSSSVQGFSLGNLRIGKYFPSSRSIVRVEAGADNLWNVAYQNIAWRAMPLRSFFVRLQWEFNSKGI